MAKSVLDAGWGTLKTLLEYKCDHAGAVFQEVNEAYSTGPVRVAALAKTVREVEQVLE